MLNNTTTAPENRRPWSSYRVGEHLPGSVLVRSSTRVAALEEPGSVDLRSWLLRSRVADSQERPSPTYSLSATSHATSAPKGPKTEGSHVRVTLPQRGCR